MFSRLWLPSWRASQMQTAFAPSGPGITAAKRWCQTRVGNVQSYVGLIPCSNLSRLFRSSADIRAAVGAMCNVSHRQQVSPASLKTPKEFAGKLLELTEALIPAAASADAKNNSSEQGRMIVRGLAMDQHGSPLLQACAGGGLLSHCVACVQ